MYFDIPFWLSAVFIGAGLVLLAWSSSKFVDAAADIARVFGISPLVIGVVIIGFGTSAPELFVSAMSGISGHAEISLGNAYGSCVFNVAVILGVSAFIFPLSAKPLVTVPSGIMLFAVAALSYFLLSDSFCSRSDAVALVAIFAVLMPLYCWFDQKTSPRPPEERPRHSRRLGRLFAKLVGSLVLLVVSSHILVHGAVDFARFLGVSELLIGLTIISVGTSLPELASAIQSARKGEHEFVLGNIVGSNLFNTLAVVGIATWISPTGDFSASIVARDIPVVMALSLSIPLLGLNFAKPRAEGVYTRGKAALWLLAYAAYLVVMVKGEVFS